VFFLTRYHILATPREVELSHVAHTGSKAGSRKAATAAVAYARKWKRTCYAPRECRDGRRGVDQYSLGIGEMPTADEMIQDRDTDETYNSLTL